jgi:hypothetical protein
MTQKQFKLVTRINKILLITNDLYCFCVMSLVINNISLMRVTNLKCFCVMSLVINNIINLFSSWYSWTIVELSLDNNHSIIHFSYLWPTIFRELNNCSAISWREQVNFQWDDDEVRFVFRPTRIALLSSPPNHISGVMVSVLASSAVDRGFKPWWGQTKDYKIGICCFSAMAQRGQ